jgi:hypothetical protein
MFASRPRSLLGNRESKYCRIQIWRMIVTPPPETGAWYIMSFSNRWEISLMALLPIASAFFGAMRMLPHTAAPEICKRERRSNIRGDLFLNSKSVETVVFCGGSGCINGSKVQLFTDCRSVERTMMATRKNCFIGCHRSLLQEQVVEGGGGAAMVMSRCR